MALKIFDLFTNFYKKLFRTKEKIAFIINGTDESGVSLERLWGTFVGKDTYILENSPFNAYGISYMDCIKTVKKDGENHFSSVVQRGGHSTFRVKLNAGDDHAKFIAYWHDLEALGCTFEGCGGDKRLLYSIDVPPKVDVDKVVSLLASKEQESIWEYEEVYIYRQPSY